MTEEMKTTDNNQKMSAYCKTCVCKSCEQVAWLEQENKEEKKAYNECMYYLACMTEQRNKLKSALEEIREMILYCEEEYNCDRCKYHDNCLVDDDKFPDFSKALVNKINEVLK